MGQNETNRTLNEWINEWKNEEWRTIILRYTQSWVLLGLWIRIRALVSEWMQTSAQTVCCALRNYYFFNFSSSYWNMKRKFHLEWQLKLVRGKLKLVATSWRRQSKSVNFVSACNLENVIEMFCVFVFVCRFVIFNFCIL